MDLRLVTSNPGKAREVRELLRPYGVGVRWVRRELPEPQSDSLEEVVRAKLLATRNVRARVLVEDSGLFIPSLGGFPGVYSSYIYRIWRFAPLLELLRHRRRDAVFRTVAGIRSGARIRLFVGECHGRISSAPRGRRGFGFDPVFIPDGASRTFAEMSTSEKNQVSHRAQALRRVGEYFRRRS